MLVSSVSLLQGYDRSITLAERARDWSAGLTTTTYPTSPLFCTAVCCYLAAHALPGGSCAPSQVLLGDALCTVGLAVEMGANNCTSFPVVHRIAQALQCHAQQSTAQHSRVVVPSVQDMNHVPASDGRPRFACPRPMRRIINQPRECSSYKKN